MDICILPLSGSKGVTVPFSSHQSQVFVISNQFVSNFIPVTCLTGFGSTISLAVAEKPVSSFIVTVTSISVSPSFNGLNFI